MEDVTKAGPENLHLQLKGVLKGHSGWVTQIATNPRFPEMIVSASRDKKVMLWQLSFDGGDGKLGIVKKSLHGHGHFVSDVVVSSDGAHALSGSWDKSMRLWDLQTGRTLRTFKPSPFHGDEQMTMYGKPGRYTWTAGHHKDILAVAFSADNRQIMSAGRDRCVKMWNTLAECKFTLSRDQQINEKGEMQPTPKDTKGQTVPHSDSWPHGDWVSCVRFSPNTLSTTTNTPQFVTAGWDRAVKVWNLTNMHLMYDCLGHNAPINSIAISPDGSLCASGCAGGEVMLWDLNEGKHLYTLQGPIVNPKNINSVCFSPNRYWLCAAVGPMIRVWDLEDKKIIDTLKVEVSAVGQRLPHGKSTPAPDCTSLAWSTDGQMLYAGYTDNVIRVWAVSHAHTQRSAAGGLQLPSF